jgi:hypothetical protein
MPLFDLSRLIAQLNASNLQQTNQVLYQVIKQLITQLQLIEEELSSAIASAGGNVDDLLDIAFLTATDASAILVNSRELLAGTNITFDDSIANQRTVNAFGSGSGVDHVVVSDGGIPNAQPINDGAGSFIYIPYVTP